MSATLPRTSMSTIDENLKRFFDCIASICGMIVFSPLFLIIMIIIKCDSKGPVIFSQERIGKGGKPFTLYKFRTMNNFLRGGRQAETLPGERRAADQGR